SVVAPMVTFPTLPVLCSASATMPVTDCGSADFPSIESVPATVTEISPPLPGPNVLLEICALLPAIDNVPTLTATFPAFPLLFDWESAKIPVLSLEIPLGPLINSISDALTETSPLFPAPNVRLEIIPSLEMLNLPAVTITLPALPPPWVSEPIPSNMEES